MSERFKKLWGVTTLPNLDANLVEKYTGLNFPHKPLRVPSYTLRNKSALWANAFISRDRRLLSTLQKRSIMNNPVEGILLEDYGAYLEHLPGLLVGLHENAHALVNAQNPELDNYRRKIEREVFLYLSGRHKAAPNISKCITSKCFTEGLAEWISIHTAIKAGSPAQQNEAKQHHNTLLSGENQEESVKLGDGVNPFIAKFINHLEKSLIILASLDFFDVSTRRKFLTFHSVWSVVEHLSFSVGYYFIAHSMEQLQNKGLPVPEALMTVIQNPPTKLSQLREPVKYAQGISN